MASKKSKVELTRVNINLPKNLVEKVKEYGESLGINTTSAYICLLNQALNQNSQISNMPLLLELLNAFKNIDNEDFNNSYTNIIKDSNKMNSLIEEIEKNN